MEYVKGKPYFCDTKQKIKQYSYLDKDKSCEILIIGGGIDGAIANFYLSKNFDVILVDKGRLGYSCTACATTLLEYQLDDYAKDLGSCMSTEDIVKAYRMGLDAVEKISSFIKQYGNNCEFALRPTFLFSNSIFSIKAIEDEYNFRISNGFECQYFNQQNNPFPFPIKSGIYAENGGCEFNPYLFTKQMIENSSNQHNIFENTNIKKLSKNANGFVAETNFGEKICCKKILIATGFNWEVLDVNDLCERFITYSIVTSPLKDFSWYNKAMIHDATTPYHYLRLLPDNRIIFGGEDAIFNEKHISERKTNKKYDKLTKSLFELFPNLKSCTTIDYKFCGSFGTTKNNMGLIGKSKIDDDILLFISCGANGIINAMKGVEVVENILLNKTDPLENLFDPKREV